MSAFQVVMAAHIVARRGGRHGCRAQALGWKRQI